MWKPILLLSIVAFVLAQFAALITHVVWCAQRMEQGWEAIVFLVLGIAPAPVVGMLHGWCIWFGAPWFNW